jgi:PAS domain S-box-containing protein
MSVTPLSDMRIRWKVLGHLLILVVLIAANIGGVWWFLQEQADDGAAINEAGDQRLLTQKMRYHAQLIGMGRAEFRDELLSDAAEFDRTLDALKAGNESMGIRPAPPSVRTELRAVEAEWDPFYERIRIVATVPRTDPQFNESLAYVQTHTQSLLAESDAAVSSYERTFDAKIHRLERFLIAIVAIDAVVIPLLFVFIDRSILRPVDRMDTEAQAVAHGDLDQAITTLDSKNEIGGLSRSLAEMKNQLVSAIRDVQRYEQAVEHAGHAIYITDTDGTIEYVNPAFEEITAYSESEALGETPALLQSGRQSESYYENLWDTIKAKEVWEEEIVNRRATGELFQAYQSVAPITDETGDLVAFVAVMNDTTERMVSKQQNQVMGRVLRHNLRNDLNVLVGDVRKIEAAEDPEERRTHTEKIRKRIDELAELSTLADRYLHEFQYETYRQRQDVPSVVERVTELMQERYPRARIESHAPATELTVQANVQLVLEELLENAIEHTDRDRPRVSVTVSQRDVTEEPPSVRISVEDDGPGISPHDRRVIAEGEETPLFHGTGLGLWAVHWTVTLAGGDVRIEDRSPRGTRVELRLPTASVGAAGDSGDSAENEPSVP